MGERMEIVTSYIKCSQCGQPAVYMLLAKNWFATNGIEGAWSLLKRQIIGIHHWVSERHLGYYVGEMTWRYNRRGMGEGERVNALVAASSGRLRYRELIA